MAEPEITIRARYRRVIQKKAYETEEGELFIEETFPGEMSPEEIVNVASAQFQAAKVEVFKQLGLGFEQDQTTGLIMENFPGTEVVKAPANARSRTSRPVTNQPTQAEERGAYTDPEDDYDPEADAPATDAPAPRPRTRPAAGQARRPAARQGGSSPNPRRRPQAAGGGRGRSSGNRGGGTTDLAGDDLLNLYLENPDDWYDNRDSKQSETSPDFRHKSLKGSNGYAVGIWLNNDTPQWFLDEIGEGSF